MAVSGYKQLYMPDYHCASKQGFVAEHRYVAEQKLGRYLKNGEVICHLDNDIFNNEESNIIVFRTVADENRYRRGGVMEEMEDGAYICYYPRPQRLCLYCGRPFDVKSTRRNQKYCCLACSQLARRKYERPTRPQLRRLLLEFSMTDIAKLYGTDSSTVVSWCHLYRLPFRRKDIYAMRARERVKETRRIEEKELKRRQKASDRLQKEIFG